MCSKGRLLLISLFDLHIVVSPSQVHLCKYSFAPHVIYQLCDQWQGIIILHSLSVELAIVHNHALSSILLSYEKYW